MALIVMLLLPLFAVQSVAAEDGTGGPALSPEFFDAPRCSRAGTNGLIVYQSLNSARTTPNRGLIVADASGDRQRVISLNGVPARLFATPYPNHAIVITTDDGGNANRIEVIDARRGFRYPLEIPTAQIGSLIYPSPATTAGAGSRYIVLSDALQRVAWLVDLRDGTVTDLLAIAQERAGDDPVSLVSATVSPDDRRVLLVTSHSVLLIPTDSPQGDRLLGTLETLGGFHFVPTEGAPLLFTRTLPDGGTSVVLLETERFAEIELAVETDLVSATPLPNGGAVILAREHSLELIELNYFARSHIFEVEEEIGALLLAPGGTRLAYEAHSEDGTIWRHVNLRTRSSTDLPDLRGLNPIASAPGLRWVIFAASAIFAQSQGGSVYYSLDLERGIALPTLVTQDGVSYLPPIVTPGEGRFALIPSLAGTIQRYDLIDNRTGQTSSLLDSRSVSAALSPDGCWAAAARVMGLRAERIFRIHLVPLDNPSSPISGEFGIAPIWLPG